MNNNNNNNNNNKQPWKFHSTIPITVINFRLNFIPKMDHHSGGGGGGVGGGGQVVNPRH